MYSQGRPLYFCTDLFQLFPSIEYVYFYLPFSVSSYARQETLIHDFYPRASFSDGNLRHSFF